MLRILDTHTTPLMCTSATARARTEQQAFQKLAYYVTSDNNCMHTSNKETLPQCMSQDPVCDDTDHMKAHTNDNDSSYTHKQDATLLPRCKSQDLVLQNAASNKAHTNDNDSSEAYTHKQGPTLLPRCKSQDPVREHAASNKAHTKDNDWLYTHKQDPNAKALVKSLRQSFLWTHEVHP
jgi:hypothetical protein